MVMESFHIGNAVLGRFPAGVDVMVLDLMRAVVIVLDDDAGNPVLALIGHFLWRFGVVCEAVKNRAKRFHFSPCASPRTRSGECGPRVSFPSRGPWRFLCCRAWHRSCSWFRRLRRDCCHTRL